MTIYSCKGCTPPKRYPGCHAKCPEYLEQKARYEELKEADDKRRQIRGEIISQRNQQYFKAVKRHRTKR